MAPGRLSAAGFLASMVVIVRAVSLFLLLSVMACTDVRLVGAVNTPGVGGNGFGAGGGGVGGGGGGTGGSSDPIEVLVWNNALVYGHAARVYGIPHLQAREASDNIHFDLTYAHTGTGYFDGPADTSFDASVFTDAGLERYDVILFLHTTGRTIDDAAKDMRRQALSDFIEKKGRGFVGTHSATDTYKDGSWPWYVDFIGASHMRHSSVPYVPGVIRYAPNVSHPILIAAGTPDPWSRRDEWFGFSRDPRSSPVPGISVLLMVWDEESGLERPTAWVHEMPLVSQAPRAGRMFYTACCHDRVTFEEEPEVIDLIVAGIKWAAYRL